ncbi:unnamed protein product [Darwinula stevensoni]|uniref:Uncharacterized protein n=1 Tax=Darwinula stevensoni TaxID=69355 RepID=A0A7R9AFC9_9CRUS|nr:unnamed protein product [Darwinula stevensoni]CAG0902774.1 unnamed protein product [Darwinula stevensoni]
MDEVPITIGFQDVITPEALSIHWKWIKDIENDVKSITVSFRPYDETYTRDFPLEDMKLAETCNVTILKSVKRNTQRISKLFKAIGEFSRRVFLSSERSLVMDVEDLNGGFLPRLFTILSCQALHRECKNEAICEAVRASHVIHAIYEECCQSPKTIPIFVVVDTEKRKMALANIISSQYDSIPVLFHDSSYKFDYASDPDRNNICWPLRGKSAQCGSFHLFIVTEKEMMGCHPKNVIIVADFPNSQWMNYSRLIATTGSGNKILLIEGEELRTGRFSRVTKDIYGWNINEENMENDRNLRQRLETAFSRFAHFSLFPKGGMGYYYRDIPTYPQPFPEMDMGQDERMEDDNEEIEKLFRGSGKGLENTIERRMIGIFGPPASGKSKYVDMLIRQAAEHEDQVLLLHPQGQLYPEFFRQRWGKNRNMEIIYYSTKEISLQEIIELNVMEFQSKEGTSPFIVIVEDCPFKEFEPIKKILKGFDVNLLMFLIFKPYSDDALSVETAIEVLKEDPECTAIVFRSQPTNVSLLKHIQQNETRTALKLQVKSLSVSSQPAAIVLGSPVLFLLYECSGRHLGYMCKGGKYCTGYARVASSLSLAALQGKTDDQPHILGVDWEPKHRPPVALKIRSKGVGLLESLSVSLTGSLLHLPLLKKRIEDEDHSSLPVSKGSDAGSMSNGELESNISDTLLHQIQLAANIFKRSIVLIGDGLSCTFRPEDEGDGEVDYRGILLFARRNLQSRRDDSPPPISILPIVPHCKPCHVKALKECGEKAMGEMMEDEDRPPWEKCQIKEDFLRCMVEKKKEECHAQAEDVNPDQVRDFRRRLMKELQRARGCYIPH